jgi:hypothetical protein
MEDPKTEDMEMIGILTTHDLANRLGIHTDAVEYLVRKGRIPAGQRVGRTNVWTEAEAVKIERWYCEYRRLAAGCCLEGHGVALKNN